MELLGPNEKLIRLLLPRLERISVDSYWAHRASGVRGALVKLLEQMEAGTEVDPASLEMNITVGFEILKEAEEELRREYRPISRRTLIKWSIIVIVMCDRRKVVILMK